ncbi:MAG: hypothetical protein MJ107_05580 [Lachnospiraceae bacterium]|nr:hypothetical protein [Lachnospiraceae bacterium]
MKRIISLTLGIFVVILSTMVFSEKAMAASTSEVKASKLSITYNKDTDKLEHDIKLTVPYVSKSKSGSNYIQMVITYYDKATKNKLNSIAYGWYISNSKKGETITFNMPISVGAVLSKTVEAEIKITDYRNNTKATLGKKDVELSESYILSVNNKNSIELCQKKYSTTYSYNGTKIDVKGQGCAILSAAVAESVLTQNPVIDPGYYSMNSEADMGKHIGHIGSIKRMDNSSEMWKSFAEEIKNGRPIMVYSDKASRFHYVLIVGVKRGVEKYDATSFLLYDPLDGSYGTETLDQSGYYKDYSKYRFTKNK